MTAADSDDFAVDQPRSRLTVAALVGLPILGNLLLAAFLFSTMPTTPGSGPSLPFVPGPVGGGGTFNWACRARDSLATMHAGPDGHIYSIRTTWFGFDPSSMDPTVWADAIFPAAADRDGSRQWLREHFGRRDGTQIGRTKIEVGGSRGAYVMTLST
jgi:hypothetical protein